MANQLEIRRKRALWRATHRGTKELDMMIGGFATAHIEEMSAAALDEFEALLEVADPKLQIWMLSPTVPEDVPEHYLTLVARVRAFHGLKRTPGSPSDNIHIDQTG